MPQIFFFDVYVGNEVIRDDKGVEVSDLDEAVREAKAVLARMQANGDFKNIAKPWRMVIHDMSGTLQKVISLDGADRD